MYFPTNQQITSYYNMFLVTGPFFLLVSSGLWIWLLRRSRQNPQSEVDLRVPIFAIVWLIIGVGHLFGTYGSVWQIIQWRHQLSDVQEVRITRTANEDAKATGNPIIVTDPTQIENGLTLLSTAHARQRNHEGFTDGYQIQIVLRSQTSRYLRVFRRTSGTGPGAIVIVLAPSWDSTVAEFSSPEFLRWVEKVEAAEKAADTD